MTFPNNVLLGHTIEQALELATQNGDVRGVALANANLSGFFELEGDEERAISLLARAREGARVAGDVYLIATVAAALAQLRLRRGETAEAAADISESIRLSGSIDDTHTLAETLAIAADVLGARGDADTATLLFGCCAAVRAAHELSFKSYERDPIEERAAVARETLGERFDDTWSHGTELELRPAVELALAALAHA